MTAYIDDDGFPTIRIPRAAVQVESGDITAIVDDIVARTDPPKGYQKFVLNQTVLNSVLGAFEGYIVKMMVDSGWRNGNSDSVDIRDFWADTHTVRQVDKDGVLCIGGVDRKGRKFVEELRRKGWLDSFLSCYDGIDDQEARILFLPESPPADYQILGWWDSNKVKLAQMRVSLSKIRPFKMSEESIFWWLRNRKWSLFSFVGLSAFIIALLVTIVGLALGIIPLPEAADRAIIYALLSGLVGLTWRYPLRPVWRKITAETPIDWGNGTIHDDPKYRDKRLAFYEKAEQEWGIA